MSIVEQELQSFQEFVRSHQQATAGMHSLEDLVFLWRSQQEREETVAAIREGLEDLEQGRIFSAQQVVQQLQQRLS